LFTYILYAAAIIGLIISYNKSRKKTKMALKKALKSFENILPQMLFVLLIIGIMLSVLDSATIATLLGSGSGALGMAIAAVIGSITLIPGFVAFPLAASLLTAGAGYGQIAMFISTLMMVGIVTIPIETTFFGREATIRRNIYAFFYCIVCALVIGGIL